METIYDVLRELIRHAYAGSEIGKDMLDAINKLDPDFVAPEPDPVPATPVDPDAAALAAAQAQVAELQAQLAAAQAPPVEAPVEPVVSETGEALQVPDTNFSG